MHVVSHFVFMPTKHRFIYKGLKAKINCIVGLFELFKLKYSICLQYKSFHLLMLKKYDISLIVIITYTQYKKIYMYSIGT